VRSLCFLCDSYSVCISAHPEREPTLAEQFDAKPAEVRALFSNTLDPARATELREKMQSAGLPV
ncbi:hypothetical protein L4Q51_006706, partial [Pseudomonas aeruginosa]